MPPVPVETRKGLSALPQGYALAEGYGRDNGIAATYPDERVALPLAEATAARAIKDFLGPHVEDWRPRHAAWKAECNATPAGEEKPARPSPTSWGVRIETAIGKTDLAVKEVARSVKAGASIVYAVPYHELADEIAARFTAEGITARAYRGYGAPDPEFSDRAMCLDLAAYHDAVAAGRGHVSASICQREDRATGETLYCPFHSECGMQRQREASADLWVIPHASLFHERPQIIPEPDALVIDEGFSGGAISDEPTRLKLDTIQGADIQPAHTDRVDARDADRLQSMRGNLLRALQEHDDGPVRREILLRHTVTVADAGSAYRLEYNRTIKVDIRPGMDPEARRAEVEKFKGHNREAAQLAGLWREIKLFLAGDADASGRLTVHTKSESAERSVLRRSLNHIRGGWHAPALLLDATLPPPELLAPILEHPVEVKASLTAFWSPHVQVRQIIGAPVSATKLGIVKNGRKAKERRGKRSTRDLYRLILLRAALAYPRLVVVIGPKRWITVLDELPLPSNVETKHFGAIAGIDRWKDAAGLICIGQQQPGPKDTEPVAGAITGRVPNAVPLNEWDAIGYPRVPAGIRLADSGVVAVERFCHPDPIVEAVRYQNTEAGQIQAVGRIRPLRRGPDNPAFIDIISDVPLPITVDRVETWEAAKVGAWAEMAAEGVILESVADIMACFPEAAPTRDKAREMTPLTLGEMSIEKLYIDKTPIVAAPNGAGTNAVRTVVYKKLGRFQPSRAIVLPNGPADLKAWLFDRVGAIEWLRHEPEAAPETKAYSTSHKHENAA